MDLAGIPTSRSLSRDALPSRARLGAFRRIATPARHSRESAKVRTQLAGLFPVENSYGLVDVLHVHTETGGTPHPRRCPTLSGNPASTAPAIDAAEFRLPIQGVTGPPGQAGRRRRGENSGSSAQRRSPLRDVCIPWRESGNDEGVRGTRERDECSAAHSPLSAPTRRSVAGDRLSTRTGRRPRRWPGPSCSCSRARSASASPAPSPREPPAASWASPGPGTRGGR